MNAEIKQQVNQRVNYWKWFAIVEFIILIIVVIGCFDYGFNLWALITGVCCLVTAILVWRFFKEKVRKLSHFHEIVDFINYKNNKTYDYTQAESARIAEGLFIIEFKSGGDYETYTVEELIDGTYRIIDRQLKTKDQVIAMIENSDIYKEGIKHKQKQKINEREYKRIIEGSRKREVEEEDDEE